MGWKSTLATVAPALASGLGTPVLGMATSAILSVFGITPSGDQETDNKAMQKAVEGMTPEQAVALQVAENQFTLDMEKLKVDVFGMEVDDRKNARKEHSESLTPSVLSGIVVIGWVGLMACLFGVDLPSGNKEIVLRALGTADAALTLCLSYWFGSSHKKEK